MLASEVMTKDVLTIRRDAPVAEAAATMACAGVSGLPVTDASGALVGILTEGDLLRRVELGTAPSRPRWLTFLRGPERAAADFVRTRTNLVDDVMTVAPVSVGPDAPLDEVVALMERNRVRRVPVVERGRLLGIVSRADLVRLLAARMAKEPPAHRRDAELRADVLAAFKGRDWHAMNEIGVSVEGGRVVLDGMVSSDAIRSALRVAAEQVPGVVSVENQIQVMDPALTAIGV